MKTCRECQTHYEDHVEVCLLDGVTLETVATPPGAVVARGTPAPVGRVSDTGATSVERRAAGGVAGLALLGAGGFVVLLLLVGVALFVMSSGEEPPPAPAPAAVTPPPAPVQPAPAPPPEPAVVTKIAFTSDPAGAMVTENGRDVCVTPCTVDHPEHAGLPRKMTLRLDGYQAADVSVADPSIPQLVKLSKIRSAPRPRPRPRPAPRPNPSPKPRPLAPAPSIGTSR